MFGGGKKGIVLCLAGGCASFVVVGWVVVDRLEFAIQVGYWRLYAVPVQGAMVDIVLQFYRGVSECFAQWKETP